jgi:Holliday junction DNA helicase RuvA
MIAALEGTVHHKFADKILLLVDHVGYSVSVAGKLLEELKNNQTILLYTYQHIREDASLLFGFKTIEELQFFEMLLTVSGIGPKTALAVINRGTSEVKGAIMKSEVSFFTAIPRLGTKNAQKLIIELKPKLSTFADLESLEEHLTQDEIVESLLSMGFTKHETANAVKSLPKNITDLGAQIKWVLKYLGSRSV